jgi:DNA-binding transcriptional MerR regulator
MVELDGVPIGAVTKMTGLSSHTLRKWESRHHVVTPTRSDSGRRLYSQAQIDRLVLLRELVDRGHPISALADQDDDALAALLEQVRDTRAAAEAHVAPRRVTLVGHVITAAARAGAGLFAPETSVELVSSDAATWLAKVEPDSTADVFVLECPTLAKPLLRRLTTLAAAQRLIVVYGFSSGDSRRALEAAGVLCLKAPIGIAELVAHLPLPAPGGRAEPRTEVPERRFSDAVIAHVAGLSPTIKCECPQHVAQLLFDLAAFEAYSAECENTHPHDAALHAYLHGVAAAARASFETALERVALAEGIALDPPPTSV